MAVIVALPAGYWLGLWAGRLVGKARPDESLLERAYQVCAGCGLGTERIDQLIDSVQHSTLSREENLELFFAAFEDPADAELCLPCAEAVMEAASHGRLIPASDGRP